MALSSDGKWLAITSGSEYGDGVALVNVADLTVASRLADTAGLTAQPSGVAFVPAAKPFIAVVNRFLPLDDPAIAPSPVNPWRDDGAAAFRASAASCVHLLRLDYDPVSGRLGPPPSSNLRDGRSFSLVANRTVDGNLWRSSFCAVTVDITRNRMLIGCRTAMSGGQTIYAAPLESFSRGGLRLVDLQPLFAVSPYLVSILLAP